MTLRTADSLDIECVCDIKVGMIKWNVNRFCLQFVTSTELTLMCFGHFGSAVRYINI
jgi:hypothetical protein